MINSSDAALLAATLPAAYTGLQFESALRGAGVSKDDRGDHNRQTSLQLECDMD